MLIVLDTVDGTISQQGETYVDHAPGGCQLETIP